MRQSISSSFFARVTRKTRGKAHFLIARKCVFYEAFDEYRDSLGTCFQGVRKGGDAVGLWNMCSRMNLYPKQGLER